MANSEEFNKKLASYDATIELWSRIPKTETETEVVLDEEHIEWSEDDWTICCACTRPEFYLSGGDKNEKR